MKKLLVLVVTGLLSVAGHANPFGTSIAFDFIFQDLTAGNDAAGFLLNGQSAMSIFVTSTTGGDNVGESPDVDEWNEASEIINNGDGTIINQGGKTIVPPVPCCSLIIDNNTGPPIGGLTEIPDKGTAAGVVAIVSEDSAVVPEPPIVALLAAGLAVVGINRRKPRR